LIKKHSFAIMVVVVLVAGVGLRFACLGQFPAGVYQDEAYNGLDALQWLQEGAQNPRMGNLPLYFTANNGREPLHIYAVTASVAWFGNTAFALRFPSALISVFGIFAMLAFGWAWRGKWFGLLCSAVWAVTLWSVALAHVSFRAGWFPVMLVLASASTLWAIRTGKLWLWMVAGAWLGLSFYTYSAAQMTPFFLALACAWTCWLVRRDLSHIGRIYQRPLILLFSVVMLFLIPWFWLVWHFPETLFARAGQVSVFSESIHKGDLPGTLLKNLVAVAGLFNLAGDRIARHNLPYRPLFDLLSGTIFIVGVVRVLGLMQDRKQTQTERILAGWLGCALLAYLPATLLAEDAPHFLRGVGVLPAAVILCALGIQFVYQLLARRVSPAYALLLPLGVLGFMAGSTTYDYFVRYPKHPDTDIFFQRVPTELAQQALQASKQQSVLLDSRFWDSFATLRYLLANQPNIQLYEGTPNFSAMQERSAGWRIFAWQYESLLPLYRQIPTGWQISAQPSALYRGDFPETPYPLYLQITAHPPQEHSPAFAIWQDTFALSAPIVTRTPTELQISLQWQCVQPPSAEPLSYFIHLLDAEGNLVAQQDGMPLNNTYPFQYWRVGEKINQIHTFSGLSNAVTMRIGLYNSTSLERWSVVQMQTPAIVSDQVLYELP
jgi:4-amino-4-deoxy-L-arabinose transferase-like glycosyltransferase